MKMKNSGNIIFILFSVILLASFFVLLNPVSAQRLGIPIKLELTAEPSTIEVGDTARITVTLLDENDEPAETEVDITVSILTNLGSVPSSLIIPAGAISSGGDFTSESSGMAVISAKSKGFIGDSASIAVMAAPTPAAPAPTPTVVTVPAPAATPAAPTPEATEEPGGDLQAIPGFETIFSVGSLLAVAYLVLRRKR